MRSVMALTVIPLLAALSACASFAPDAAVAVKQIAAGPGGDASDRGRPARRAGVRGAGPGALGGEPARRYAAAAHRPGGTLTTVTLDWTGPVETLAEELARRAGYRFFAAGPVPARPAIVAVKTRDAPLIAVLRDAGIQAGQAAVLTVDADRRIVRLDWAAPDHSPRIGKTGKEGS